jgi:hypothetical protein
VSDVKSYDEHCSRTVRVDWKWFNDSLPENNEPVTIVHDQGFANPSGREV